MKRLKHKVGTQAFEGEIFGKDVRISAGISYHGDPRDSSESELIKKKSFVHWDSNMQSTGHQNKEQRGRT